MSTNNLPCIRVTGFGFVTDLSYTDWASDEIQDRDEALRIAESILRNDNYRYREHEQPRLYREYDLISSSVLEDEIAAEKAALEVE